MKVGDLVRPVPADGPVCYTTAPIVGEDYVGIIIDFTKSELLRPFDAAGHPVVYWNPAFPAEVEYPDQIEVIR